MYIVNRNSYKLGKYIENWKLNKYINYKYL